LLVDRTPTPLGELLIVSDINGRLRGLNWTDREVRLLEELRLQLRGRAFALMPCSDTTGLTRALNAYFDGELGAIDRLPVETGGTAFQQQVWTALRGIRCGETISYAELARRIGRPSAVRAVGLANGSNPISIVVPCHRVIGSSGALTGYGGGLERKQWLLAHERGARQA
jgi:methylated-DNA-[protein]-cysteine S-methyltransferase